MNIDVKTGLPELPEGYYWKIEKIDIERKLFNIRLCTYPTLRVQIWGPYGLELTEELVEKTVNRDEEHANRLAELGFEPLTEGYLNVHFNLIREWIRIPEPTAENIYKLAVPLTERLVELVEIKRKEREERERLDAALDQFVGVYPPNNLKEII